MMRNTKFVIVVCIILLGASISVGITMSLVTATKEPLVLENMAQAHNNQHEEESSIIDNPRVPYVGQTTDWYCGQAAMTMLINYYGFNASLEEILHNLGYGYSFACNKFIPPLERIPYGGYSFIDRGFLAGLYNLSYRDYSVFGNQSADVLWEKYWTRVKEFIANDIPVQTSVDIYSLPYWRNKLNITGNDTHGGHAIVIVGFNESNGTVCYNDPATALLDEEGNGTYVFIKVDVFARAVRYSQGGTLYVIYVFEKTSTSPPPSHAERFVKAHNQNIQRLAGVSDVFFGLNISELPLFYRLLLSFIFPVGVNAAKALKKYFQIGVFYRMTTVHKYSQYETYFLYSVYDMISTEKYNVSQYLLENTHISAICRYDGTLLKEESGLWRNLSLHIKELNVISKNNTLLTTLIVSRPLLNEIHKLLDDIIQIEENIINGYYTQSARL